MSRVREVPQWRTAWRRRRRSRVRVCARDVPDAACRAAAGPRARHHYIDDVNSASRLGAAPSSPRRSGNLRLRIRRDDPLVAGRAHERYDQYHSRRARVRRRRGRTVVRRPGGLGIRQRLRGHRRRHLAGDRGRPRPRNHRGARRSRNRPDAGARDPAARTTASC